MLYVLLEIWIWVASAAALGALFGWAARSIRARRQVAREAMIWQRRLRRERTLATLKQQTQTPGTDDS